MNTESAASLVDVTFLMPCLNEAQSLPVCIERCREALKALESKGFTGEILISDNGSDDGSQTIALERQCRVVNCERRGYGAALGFGCRNAQGRYIVMGDSDASYDFAEGVAMVEALEEGFDLCMGNRFKGKIHPGAMPWKNKHIGNPVLTGILNLFYHTGVGDAHSGLRWIRKEAFEQLNLQSPGMEFASEMVVKASLHKLKVTEVPISLHPDKRGRPPHLNPWRDGLRHLWFLFMLSPLWTYFIPSFLLFLFSSFLLFGLLLTPSGEMFRFGSFQFGDHWMILAGTFFGVSVSGILMGYLALILALKDGYRIPSKNTQRLRRIFSVQNLLSASLICVGVGGTIFGYVFYIWAERSFSGLDKTREMVLCASFLGLGFKLVFWSVIFSLLGETTD